MKALITLSELQTKEVIMMNGKRLGFIDDLEIDEQNGFITAIILVERHGKGGTFFQKPAERIIHWEQILTIGNDIILVDDLIEKEKSDN